MNKEEAREEYNRIQWALKELGIQKKRILMDWEILGERCEHPDKYRTSHMGESCTDCPDCGRCL